MKRLFLLIAPFIAPLLLLAGSFAHAQPDILSLTQEVGGKSGYDVQNVTDTTISETIGRIIRIALSLVGTIFFVLTIYSGFLWMTAQGNEEQVEKAMKIIKTSAVGLVIVMAAYGLSAFLVGIVALTSDAPVGGKVGPGYGTGGFWTSFGKTFKDTWWNWVF